MIEDTQKSSPLGLTGVIVGIAALGIALAHFWLGPIEPPPPLEEVVAEKGVKLKKAVEARLRGAVTKERPEAATRELNKDEILRAVTIGIAFLAIVLAVVSFIRRENLRVSGSAAALGTGAVAFEFAALALGVIVVVILVAAVLHVVGIGA